VSGDELSLTVAASVAASACIGALLGALATLLMRAKREQALRLEAELLRARIKSDDALAAERATADARARDHLGAVFGELSRNSLQGNSEVFLQLAGERLTRQQQDASSALRAREAAIESLVLPIRDALAKTEAQMQSIERERIEAFAAIKSQMEALGSGQSLLSRETRNLVTALPRCSRPVGRNHAEAAGGTVRHDRARRLHRAAAPHDGVRRHPARHDRPHARTARHRRRRQNAAGRLSRGS
jgi:gas vesicle protein